MSVVDLLLDLFRSEEEQAAFADDPAAYLDQHAPDGLTAEDVLAAMPAVCGELPPEQAEFLRTAYGISSSAADGSPGGASGGGGGGGSAAVIETQAGAVPPPPTPVPGGDPVEQAIQQINHYTNVVNISHQTFEDNDTTYIDDRDTTVDNSVNQNIQAFGDVNQTFDNDVVSGDGAVAAGDGSQVNTGAGAVQAGGDITDSTIATGDVGGSVTGDVTDSIVGDGNQAIQNSEVGAASFGAGDATNVEAGNAVLGSGTIVDANGDVALNQGSGDLTQIQDSTLSESVVGGGTVQSNDTTVDAGDGNAFAFGDGDATADTQTTNIDGNYGNVQVAGDYSDQAIDNSVDIADSGNVTDSGNVALDYSDHSVDNSIDIADSGNTAVDYSDHSIDNSVDIDNSGNTTIDAGDDGPADVDIALG